MRVINNAIETYNAFRSRSDEHIWACSIFEWVSVTVVIYCTFVVLISR